MKQNLIEHWDEEHGVARCVLKYRMSSGAYLEGIGIAECHSEDIAFMSRLTGSVIAQYRAELDLLKKINQYEISPSIMAVKHIYCTMTNSKRYNPDSYEANRIKKELAHLMDEYTENKNLMKIIKEELKQYIEQKDKLYRRIQEGQK